mmetsp:Transcript_25077/g.38789  ORF Transcript_25077/g.38789 Transcript_25077/m.38789 type:complete len:89 (+) Transcript_25077:2121-2387(+)
MFRVTHMQAQGGFRRAARHFSEKSAAPEVKKSGGAGFFSRLSSFIVGAGVSALGAQYYIYNELVEGNKVILDKQRAIEKRLSSLESKK